jgi:hypothetical protein
MRVSYCYLSAWRVGKDEGRTMRDESLGAGN